MIRQMQEADIDRITAITVDAWSYVSPRKLLEDRHGLIGATPWREKKGQDVRAFCLTNPRNVIVTLADGVVVGYATFSIDEENGIGYILNNAVDSAYQRRGIGTEMNTWIIAHFRALGLRIAQVSTDASNSAAQTIYEKQGFEELSRTVHYSMSL